VGLLLSLRLDRKRHLFFKVLLEKYIFVADIQEKPLRSGGRGKSEISTGAWDQC